MFKRVRWSRPELLEEMDLRGGYFTPKFCCRDWARGVKDDEEGGGGALRAGRNISRRRGAARGELKRISFWGWHRWGLPSFLEVTRRKGFHILHLEGNGLGKLKNSR